jgi:hypothetical protein
LKEGGREKERARETMSLMVTVPGALGGKLHCQAGPGHYVL